MLLEKALTVAAAKAKLAGLVVAAAAVGGTAAATGTFVPTSGEEVVVADASPSPEASPSAEPTPVVVETTPSPEATASVEPTPSLPPCPADVKNHGAYVSSVAKDKSVKGREHGKRVSAAAHSDCGKPAGTEAADDDADEATSEDVAELEDDADEAEDADEATEDEPTTDASPKAKKGKGHGRG